MSVILTSETGLPLEHAADVARRVKWTGDDLVRLTELGVLSPDKKFELMDGEIIELMPAGPAHIMAVGVIAEVLEGEFPRSAFHVRQEKPVRLGVHYDPLPDLAVVKGHWRDYPARLPGPSDVVLVVEVADTSVERDRSEKLAAYSAAGIPEYWLANLRDGQVEVHREPREGEYLWRRVYRRGEAISPLASPESSLPVASLLGQG
jgi:Uma2 family endonuclease